VPCAFQDETSHQPTIHSCSLACLLPAWFTNASPTPWPGTSVSEYNLRPSYPSTTNINKRILSNMCHEIYWLLPCGHPRIIHTYCEDYFSEWTELGSPSPCPWLAKTRGELDNECAFCTQPECPYQGRGWWCCNCKRRNIGQPQLLCRNSPPPIAVGDPSPDLATKLVCGHDRCAKCTSDFEQYVFPVLLMGLRGMYRGLAYLGLPGAF
jgi:hypothetical protein